MGVRSVEVENFTFQIYSVPVHLRDNNDRQ